MVNNITNAPVKGYTPGEHISGPKLPAAGVAQDNEPHAKAAAPRARDVSASPAGPGQPIDGSDAVNTYTPPDVQAQEFASGEQDWQSRVAGNAGVAPPKPPPVRVLTPAESAEQAARDRIKQLEQERQDKAKT